MSKKDRLLIPMDNGATEEQLNEIRAGLERQLPGYEIIIVSGMRGSATIVPRTISEALT